MISRLTISILIVSLLNYLACTTLNVASKDEIKKELDEGTLRGDLYIITKDNNRYHFGDWGYKIENDTLYGKGFKINPNGEEIYDGKIPSDQISHFQVEEADVMATVGLVLGVAAVGLLVFGIILINSLSDDLGCSRR